MGRYILSPFSLSCLSFFSFFFNFLSRPAGESQVARVIKLTQDSLFLISLDECERDGEPPDPISFRLYGDKYFPRSFREDFFSSADASYGPSALNVAILFTTRSVSGNTFVRSSGATIQLLYRPICILWAKRVFGSKGEEEANGDFQKYQSRH